MQLRASAVVDNEGMQLRIDALNSRVQELERALQDAQRNTSSSNDPMLEDSLTSPPSPGPSSIRNRPDRESKIPHGERHLSHPCLHFQLGLQARCIWVPPAMQGFLAQPHAQITWYTYATPILRFSTQVECMGFN